MIQSLIISLLEIKEELKKEIKKVIKECYGDFIFDLPDGLNTIVGDRGLMLSGGQQRLVQLELFKQFRTFDT